MTLAPAFGRLGQAELVAQPADLIFSAYRVINVSLYCLYGLVSAHLLSQDLLRLCKQTATTFKEERMLLSPTSTTTLLPLDELGLNLNPDDHCRCGR